MLRDFALEKVPLMKAKGFKAVRNQTYIVVGSDLSVLPLRRYDALCESFFKEMYSRLMAELERPFGSDASPKRLWELKVYMGSELRNPSMPSRF